MSIITTQYYIHKSNMILCTSSSFNVNINKIESLLHCVYDPTLQYSAGQPLPKQMFNKSDCILISEEDINLFFNSREEFFEKCAYYYI